MFDKHFEPGMTTFMKKQADCIRFLAVDAVEKARSGHPGLPMGMADVMTVLYRDFLKYNPQDPLWPDRDRFVLSAGHGSMMLYAVLYLTGYENMTLDQLKNFRQLGSETPGHPEHNPAYGIETTTGPLGQGVANAVGMAMAERLLSHQYPEFMDHDTYVLAGDGCLMEGIAQEAISFAGHQQLSKLTLLFDDNGITIDGKTELAITINHQQFFESCGWHVVKVDGHDCDAIYAALQAAKAEHQKPTAILCKTVIGYGAPTKAGTEAVHGSPLGAQETELLREAFDWPYEPFEIPDELKQSWEAMPHRCNEAYSKWHNALELLPDDRRDDFFQRLNRQITFDSKADFSHTMATRLENKDMATRKCSDVVLSDLIKFVPELIGGSADLTGSNNTRVAGMMAIQAQHPFGNYIHYGIREHAMAGIMNGLATHGGFIPYGGTFLVFSDYCRASIRLSALMGLRVIYVLTHDSIGLGEDGPTHQPIEQLMSLRLIPNLLVFRPADLVETAEAWQCALQETSRPSAIVLSRQNLPQLNSWRENNQSEKGAYRLCSHSSVIQFTLIATGSEVSLALEVYEKLTEAGYKGALVSMPCTDYFEQLTPEEKTEIIGDESVSKFVIEAGTSKGWASILNQIVTVFGIDTYGVSAPKEDAYAHFGLTPDLLVKKIKSTLEE